MDFGAALIGLLVSFVTKVVIMVFAAMLLLRGFKAAHPAGPPRDLRYLVPTEDRGRFRLLYLSLALFFVSEIFCGIEIYIILQTSDVFRALHSTSSSLGMALFALGLFELLDGRVIQHGTHRCALNRVCAGCPMTKGGECRFATVFLVAGAFMALAAIPPLFAPTDRIPADPRAWLLPFPGLNAWYDGVVVPWLAAHIPGYRPLGAAFFLPASTQILDFRVLPAIALAVALVGVARLASDRRRRGLRWIVFASGLLAYSYFELILNRAMGDLFLGALGHEVGEFAFLWLLSELLVRFFPSPSAASDSRVEKNRDASTADSPRPAR